MKTVIFDFDGTIADSFGYVLEEFNHRCEKLGEKKLGLYEVKQMKNKSFKEVISKYKLWKIILIGFGIQRSMLKDYKTIKLHTGIKKLFRDLKEEGCELMVFTNNSRAIVQKYLKYHNIDQHISKIYTSRNFKDKSKTLAKIVKENKLNKKDVVYVGDEIKDILASQEVGVDVISVSWGFNSKKSLLALNSKLANKASDIRAYLV